MSGFGYLAQQVSPASGDPRVAWLPVALLLLIGIGFAVMNVIASVVIGPSRSGPGKEMTYESGMTAIGSAHRRFNVRFYVVAMIFLVFDVEIVFLYPWASIFAPAAQGWASDATILLVEILIFVAILLVAYVYAWGKGVFRWD